MEIIVTLVAIAIILIVAGWLFKLVKNTVQTLLLIGFVLLAIYFLWGLEPAAIWDQILTWLGRGTR